jgi:biotin carboxyl carrier protein
LLKKNGKTITILILTCLLVLAGVATVVGAVTGNTVDQVSSLNGCVVPEGLVTAGTVVKEGQVLVMVRTFAGNAPAARATVDGTVTEVLVAPETMIKAGQVVAKIKPN